MVRSYSKTIIRALVVITMLMRSIDAHDQETFLQANALYTSGQYQQAINLYQSIPRKGGGIYLNLGNAYYHQGDLVSALIQWKKAQRLARGSLLRTILKQIALVEQQLQIPPSSYTPLLMNVGPYVSFIPMMVMQLLWLLLICMLLLNIVKKSGSKRALNVLVLLFVCALVSSIMAMKQVLQLPSCAVVHKAQTPLFAGPNNQYHAMSMLPAGSQVSICKQRATWCKIACGNNVGWVESSALVVV